MPYYPIDQSTSGYDTNESIEILNWHNKPNSFTVAFFYSFRVYNPKFARYNLILVEKTFFDTIDHVITEWEYDNIVSLHSYTLKIPDSTLEAIDNVVLDINLNAIDTDVIYYGHNMNNRLCYSINPPLHQLTFWKLKS